MRAANIHFNRLAWTFAIFTSSVRPDACDLRFKVGLNRCEVGLDACELRFKVGLNPCEVGLSGEVSVEELDLLVGERFDLACSVKPLAVRFLTNRWLSKTMASFMTYLDYHVE